MTQEEFNTFALELAARFRGTGHKWVVIVAGPDFLVSPHSAGNVDVPVQVHMLRGIADSLEQNAVEIIRKNLGPNPEHRG